MKNKSLEKNLLPVALSVVAAIAPCFDAIAIGTQSQELSADQNPVTVAQVPINAITAEASTPPIEASSAMPVAELPAESRTVAVTEVAVTEVAVTGAEPFGALNFNPPATNPVAGEASPNPLQTDSSPTEIVETLPSETTSPHPQGTAETAASSNGDKLFQGGSESLVARTVGAAEGTRAADGGKTSLYEGHSDPGNGVWNRGTFSYQFGNEENLTAEEADRRQLAKIQRIHDSVLLPKAAEKGIAPLTLAEEINGIDLINQAPLAVTEAGGYVERLAEAKKKGLSGDEAILDARIWAFWDANKGGWDAPGLRAYDDMGKEASIRHDQDRRMGMINQALEAYQQQHGAIAKVEVAPSSTDSSHTAIAEVTPSS
jgi:hypothetical protein